MTILLAVLVWAVAAPLQAERPARYEAVFSDGSRVEGDRITGWGEHPGSPRLDDTPLKDAKRPLRWLTDRSLQPWRMPAEGAEVVEFVGGDRIVGRVAGCRPGAETDGIHTPAHLLVVPAPGLPTAPGSAEANTVRVLIDGIRRIVLRRTRRPRAYRPGTLIYRDGGRVDFVAVRPGKDALRLLLSDGSLDVGLANVAEIHFPHVDPWQAYFRELAALSPACGSRLVRIETVGGLVVTGSDLRFRAVPYRAKRAAPGPRRHSDAWAHAIQPAWSLDALRVPFARIAMWWSFAPWEVPLGRVRPAGAVCPPLQPWQANRNSAGRPLHSGSRRYAWGFAVHAYSELRFLLPACARAFHSTVGLDRLVGMGGCARARVYVGSVAGKPAYESPLLIGSEKTVDTGRVRLDLAAEGPRRLVLQADPAVRDAPPRADPLNVRDKLDWLDPWLELDRGSLRAQVARHVGPLIAAEKGWTLLPAGRGEHVWTGLLDDTHAHGRGRFLAMLRVERQPMRLRREMTIGPGSTWLVVRLGLETAENPRPDVVALYVNQREVRPRKMPIRQRWQERPTPIVFSLERYKGRKVTLELTQPPGDKPLLWSAVRTSATAPEPYRLVDALALAHLGDSHVPYALAQVLQSTRIGRREKQAVLEIRQLGGVVNYRPCGTAGTADGLGNLLVGRDWTGGDKTFVKAFATFRKMPSLRTLLVTRASGVSDGAIARLRTDMPALTVHRFIKRIPSAEGGRGGNVTWRNGCQRDLAILWVDPQGVLTFSSTPRLTPGQELKRHAFAGIRYEAHFLRRDFTRAEDYLFTQPLSTFNAAPDAVWEIKPAGR